jgi:hypothetical protein
MSLWTPARIPRFGTSSSNFQRTTFVKMATIRQLLSRQAGQSGFFKGRISFSVLTLFGSKHGIHLPGRAPPGVLFHRHSLQKPIIKIYSSKKPIHPLTLILPVRSDIIAVVGYAGTE